MDIELFEFPGSNACLTTTLLLQSRGIAWRSHHLRPMLHVASLRRRGFARGTVPAALIDGARVQGTIAIAHALDEAMPELGLIPREEPARAQVLEAERLGERLQRTARRLVYRVAAQDVRLIDPLIRANFGSLPSPVRTALALTLRAGAQRGHGATAAREAHEVDRLRSLLTQLDALTVAGYLGQELPMVGDFQVAPNLALLASLDGLDVLLQARPCWEAARRLMPTYPLELQGAAPAAWLATLSG